MTETFGNPGIPPACGAPGGVRWTTAGDIVLVVVLIGCVVAIGAHGPSTTYAHAQLQQIGAVVGTIQSGEWLLPRDQMGGLARKPQLYAWLDAPILVLTGIYDDFTFRLPTVLASLATGLGVYWLGRRWYGRRAGLIAACLWATVHPMTKLMYVAVTDMMMTMWLTASILCADRLLFHRTPGRRGWWVVGLWATMILGAMTKGWGVLNLILLGGMGAMATAVWPGFASCRAVEGAARKLLLALRLILRRWRRAMKTVRFGWGMLAMAAALAPVWVGMFVQGGEEFRKIVRFEFIGRITGQGGIVPHSASAPAVAHLLYHMLPVTVFAIGAMALIRPRRWLSRRSPIVLPLCWMVAVVLPFSLTHGFRPDYLLPCYAAGALMGGWAVEELLRRATAAGWWVSFVRHLVAAPAVTVSALLVIVPPVFLLHTQMPEWIAKSLPTPSIIETETWWIAAALVGVGAVGLVVAVRSSLRWRLRWLVVVTVVGMLGVMFVDTHFLSRHARTGDGERLLRFGRGARAAIGDEKTAVFMAEKLGTELYLGRFGLRLADLTDTTGRKKHDRAKHRARVVLEGLRDCDSVYLITCDRGLIELGAAVGGQGGYASEIGGEEVCFHPQPGALGEVELSTPRPIFSQHWGRAYVIRVDRRKLARRIAEKMYNRAVSLGYFSGKRN